MGNCLIKAVPTGRKDKLPETRAALTIAGVKCAVVESDAWEGGCEGIRQQYHRCTWLEAPEVRWMHD